MAYHASYTDFVVKFILENVDSQRVFEAIERARGLLEVMPEMGRLYDPEYQAARLPFPCRMFAVPDTPFTMYYAINEQLQEACIFYIVHQAMDPEERFAYSVIPWD